MVRLRPANTSDLDDLMEIERTCFPKDIQVSRSVIAANLRSASVDILVAEDEEHSLTKVWRQVVGCVIIFYRKNSTKAYIDSLAVLPKYRRQGIANSLKEMATLYAYARGVKEIHSDVAVTNRKMIKLNESLGYKITGKKLHYYGNGKHAYHFVKE